MAGIEVGVARLFDVEKLRCALVGRINITWIFDELLPG
jgi:hypothetical protein